MSNGEKQYYDRDDLDEDEQKLFDEMVLEEMAKLENQLMKSSVEDVSGSFNYSSPRAGDTDQYSDRYAADQPSSYYRNGSASHSQKSEQSHPYDSELRSTSTGRNAYRSGDEFYRNAPRITVDEVSRRSPLQNNRRGHFPYSPGMSSNSPDKADAESRHSQRDSRHHSDGNSSSPLQSPRNNVRRLREPEPEPESPSNMRSESRFSQNGGFPAMTSSLPSRYGAQTTEDTNIYDSAAEDRNIPRGDNRLSQKSRGRHFDDESAQPEEANPLSSIGESSHQMSAQRRKEQQAEYAQQLLNQQTYRQQQGDVPIRGVSPRSPPGDTVLYSPRSRRDSINHPDNSRPVSGRSGVVNFGSDPEAEAAKKREMKMAYGKQLQDQQYSNQSAKGYEVSGSARSDLRSEAVSSSRNNNSNGNSNSGIEDERSSAVSAAELKKMQQRKYYDEITAAAAASPITSARKALKGGPLSRHEHLKAGMADSYDNNPKNGVTDYATLSNHLSSADAERVESRLKKIQLQQLYAKQLSDDASALNATPFGRISTSGSGSRRISSARIDPRASSHAVSSAGGDGKGLFGSMSEADQLASALAKKKAAQLEYYQQLQEAESVRAQHQSDPQMNRRASLYRTRDQKEQDDARGRSREDRQTPPVGVGRDTGAGSGYGQHSDRGRYQDQGQDPGNNGYGSAKAMQVTSAMQMSRNMMEGGGNTARQREGHGQAGQGQGQGELDEFYSRTPHSIGETGRMTDTYNTQRDPDHGRNHHSNGCEHSNSRSVLDSRQRGAYSHPSDRNGDRDTVQDDYEVAGDDRYQDRMPNRREEPRDLKVEQHRYSDSEGRLGQNRMRDEDHGRQFDQVSTRDDDMRYQEKEVLQGSGRLGQSSSGYVPSRGAPSHMRVSESRIRLENPSGQMSSGRRGVDDEGDRDRERDRDSESDRDRERDRDRNRDGYPSGQGRNYEHSNSPPDNLTSPPYNDIRDRVGYDTYSPSGNPQRAREMNSDRLSDKSNRQHINYTASDSHSSQYGGSGSVSGAGPGYDRDRDRGGVPGRPMVQNTVAGRGRSSGGGVSSITL